MVAASLTGYPAAFYLYLYICIMTIYAKNIKYHMEYYVTELQIEPKRREFKKMIGKAFSLDLPSQKIGNDGMSSHMI